MKIRFLLCLLAMLLCAGTAFADPDEGTSETTVVNVSKKELFEAIIKKNPAIEKLRGLLDLEFI